MDSSPLTVAAKLDLTAAAATGFATAFSLIMAIGVQNAFVLRQGVLRRNVFWVCLICAVSDAILISAGVLLARTLGDHAQRQIEWITWAGAAFLIAYGGLAAVRAMSPGRLVLSENGKRPLGADVVTCLALTWMNPHVYVDTVGLIGAVSTGFIQVIEKAAFAGGAISASFTFFFALGYGARILAPLLSRPGAWAALDALIAIVMWSIAASLVAGVV